MNERHLMVIRHASAGADRGPRGDFDRALDERGRTEARSLGRRLVELGHRPEWMVASGAVRARQTAETLAAELGLPSDRIELFDDLYLAGVPTLLEFVHGLDPGRRNVALVGHNHGITDLCGVLCDESLAAIPTCGVVAMALSVESWSEVGPGCASRLDLGL